MGFEAGVRSWDFTRIILLHGRGLPTGERLHGRRLLEFAARLFLHGRGSPAGERLHGEVMSSRQEAAARTEGRSGVWHSWKRLHGRRLRQRD
ncbi:hypothetical protein Csa_023889 [Cucumis sativus]|nr:hypothetical protein Csa_023889 [Cucumis sativus]